MAISRFFKMSAVHYLKFLKVYFKGTELSGVNIRVSVPNFVEIG